MSEESGRLGIANPVRGIVQCASSDLSLGGVSVVVSPSTDIEDELEDSSNELGSTSRSGSGGDSNGREFVNLRSNSRQMALMTSRSTAAKSLAVNVLYLT